LPETDEAGKSGTLPPAELNPLLNPLLHENLDRWVEVYFTTPPEKRDEAVKRLLRELEGREPAEHAIPKDPPNGGSSLDPFQATLAAKPEARRLTCQACGFITRPNQKFCGRCGTRLVYDPPQVITDNHEETASPSRDAKERIAAVSDSELDAQPSQSYGRESEIAPRFGYAVDEDGAPAGYSYRLLVGAVFALLLGTLAYFAWRGGRGNSAAGDLPQPAPQAAAAPAVAPAPAANSNQSNANAAPPEAAKAQTKQAQEATTQTPPVKAPPESDSGAAKTAAPGNGATELATAQKLLDGGGGTPRDSSQAAEWLWKSVEKKNTAAMVTLANLYLHGNGVPKSCDQSRVLLDAAATKGNKEAAGLLRNLPAFGCE
jgi:hypothetical protein